VGAHIKALEAQLGQPLFHRNRGSRPRLTKAGEAVYAYAVDVLQRSEVPTRTLADLRASATREITIAVHRDIAAYFLPERLTAFAARYPKVRVITRVGTIDEIVKLLRSQIATIGLFLAFWAMKVWNWSQRRSIRWLRSATCRRRSLAAPPSLPACAIRDSTK
jgi:DNA-binding transcriptional LysR family regulator